MSAIIKIGIDRSRIGDILVDDDGADLILFDINSDYIIQGLSELTRFRKSRIAKINLNNIRKKENNFENLSIIVPSLRCDSVVSELAKCSRNKALELIEQERVLINYETITKPSKIVNYGETVTIRGKGKFIIDGLVKNTRSDKMLVNVRKYA